MESIQTDPNLLKSSAEIRKSKRFKGYLQLPKGLTPALSKAGLSTGAIVTYYSVASSAYFDHANHTYSRSPFLVTQLAEILGKSRNSVATWLRELEAVGLVAQTDDRTWVVVHYQSLFIQVKRTSDGKPGLAMREDFEQEISELFPKLSERRR